MAAQDIFPLAVWPQGITQASIPANENALRVEVLARAAIGIADSEPGAPEDGDQYVIGTAWGGFAPGDVVIYRGGWLGFAPFEGWLKSIDGEIYSYTSGEWVPVQDAMLRQELGTPGDTSGAGLAAFVQSGVGAVPMDVQNVIRQIGVTPEQFGAAGDGTTNDTAALQAAINASVSLNRQVILAAKHYAFDSTLLIPSGCRITGRGPEHSRLVFTGSGVALVTNSQGVRTYGWGFSGFRVVAPGGGACGILMDSVSTSVFQDVQTSGFAIGLEIHSPTSGFGAYNRFFGCSFQGPIGIRLRGPSSNANVFIGCRTNLSTDAGVLIEDSNENHFYACQFEAGGSGDAVRITASVPGISPANVFFGCRVEGYNPGTGWDIGVNVADTVILAPLFLGGNPSAPVDDKGLRTRVLFANGASVGAKDSSSLPATLGPAWRFTRLTQGGSEVPAFVIRDDAAGGGTPVTLQIETERALSPSLRIVRGGVTQAAISSSGAVTCNSLSAGGGVSLTAIRSTNVAHDFPSIASGATATLDVAVAGVVFTGNPVVLVGNNNASSIIYTGKVIAADTVRVYAYNPTAAAIDPPSQSIRVAVMYLTP